MGLFGMSLGKIAGGMLGGAIGGKRGRKIGSELGTLAGSQLTPYKKGGKVLKTGPALIHAGEYVLPVGVKPTKAQKQQVNKGKKKK